MFKVVEKLLPNVVTRAEGKVRFWETEIESLTNALRGLESKRDALLLELPEANHLKQLAELRDGIAAAQDRLTEARSGLKAAQATLLTAQADAERQRISENQVKARVLMKQRESLAPELQAHVIATARLFGQMDTLRRQVMALLPESRRRSKYEPEHELDNALLTAIQQTLILESNGLIGDLRAAGIYSLGELRKVAQDIPATVAESNRRLIGNIDNKEAA